MIGSKRSDQEREDTPGKCKSKFVHGCKLMLLWSHKIRGRGCMRKIDMLTTRNGFLKAYQSALAAMMAMYVARRVIQHRK
jgi:hypothetical protein